MNIYEILAPDRTYTNLSASSKKKAIEFIAEVNSSSLPRLQQGEIYRGLIEREKLGTTAIGEGFAIPHCRLSKCDKIIGGLFVFKEALDFSAPDERGVNIIFSLLVPEDEHSQHLKTLAMLAKGFSDAETKQQLLQAPNDKNLYEAALKIKVMP